EHVLVPMVAALVIVAGLLATAGPARRALRVQPMEALRLERFSRITAAGPPARSPAPGPRTRTHARAAAARGGRTARAPPRRARTAAARASACARARESGVAPGSPEPRTQGRR